MPVLLDEDLNIKLPKMTRVRQKFNNEHITNLEEVLKKELSKEEIKRNIKPGQKVAVAVGSRGVSNLDLIVKTTAEYLKAGGAHPYIVSAMGSHGGATAEGQRQILESYGITEESMGVPVAASLDVIKLGTVDNGREVYFDKTAYEADMTVLINRVKPHTDFDGDIESGLCKLAAIGLGNHAGCCSLHKSRLQEFSATIKEAAEIIFNKANIGFGLTIVENPYDEICLLEAIPVENIVSREVEILKFAKTRLAKINIPEIDILIIEEIGKNISGSGADPNIVGGYGPKALSENVPKIKWIVILGLTEESHGNAVGIGIGHITTKKVLDQIDFETTCANCMAGGSEYGFQIGFLPLVTGNEREAVAAAMKLWNGPDPLACKIVRIRNTADLEYIMVSEALIPYVDQHKESFERIDVNPRCEPKKHCFPLRR